MGVPGVYFQDISIDGVLLKKHPPNFGLLETNTDDWRLSREDLRVLYAGMDHEIGGDTEAPSKVQAVPQSKSDLFALGKLMIGDEPYKI